MLLTDFIDALVTRLNKHEDYRYHPETGEDVLGPCEIYVDIFDENKAYKGYSSEIVTFIDHSNGNIVISAFSDEQSIKGPHEPLNI